MLHAINTDYILPPHLPMLKEHSSNRSFIKPQKAISVNYPKHTIKGSLVFLGG